MLIVHHLGKSQSERIVWLCEELDLPYELKRTARDAQSRSISITTVYTHLRRTREKTGWKSVAELTRRFHEVNVALRGN